MNKARPVFRNGLPAMLAKALMIVMMTVMAAAPARAVLKERTLSKTLKVLCAELELNYKKQKRFIETAERRTEKRHNELVTLTKRSQQISLMLYSLPSDYVFDITYACSQATSLYDEFNKDIESGTTSFNYLNLLLDDVRRYDGLIRALENLPPTLPHSKSPLVEAAKKDTAAVVDTTAEAMKIDELTEEVNEGQPYELTESEQAIRDKCIMYAKALRNNYLRFYKYMKADERHYKNVSACLTDLNNYALSLYDKLYNSLTEPDEDYFTVLASLPTKFKSGTSKVKEKYERLEPDSDWRGPVVLFVSILIIFYMSISSALSYLLIVLLPKMPNRVGRYIRTHRIYQDKKEMISYAFGVAVFAIAIGLVKFAVVDNHLILMATSFMYVYAWLFFVIILSLTIRNSGDKMNHGFSSYIPFLCTAFLVIIMRIVFMPKSVMNLIFPPVILCTMIWQIFNMRKHRKYLATSDLTFAYISLAAMVFASLSSWAGYTLMGVETIVWWSFQLAFIQTVACIRDIVEEHEKTRFMTRLRINHHIASSVSDTHLLERMRNGDFIKSTWWLDFLRTTLIPIFAVMSIVLSMICEADFFNSTSMYREMFEANFIDVPDVIQVSMLKLYIALLTFFVFRYVLYVVRSSYRIAKVSNASQQKQQNPNITLANNVMVLLVWGVYFIFCLVLFNVPKSGVSAISAGLATGLCFSMKDLLENFFYGISLMTGRVRVGDYIECDGTFGHVESITYQSTQIITLDGSTVAFLNKSLFSKNFRNLTRTTNYTLVKLPVGVAYGTNVEHVRKVLVDHLNAFYDKYKEAHPNMRRPTINEKGFSVVLSEFGDSSVDLLVIFWVLVEQRIPFNGMVKEQIYVALNNAGIEIPFPQRDIHIIKPAEA